MSPYFRDIAQVEEPRIRSFVASVDLGQAADYSAIAILEAVTVPRPAAVAVGIVPDPHPMACLDCIHLGRWPLGTSYVQIVEDLIKVLRRPPLAGSCVLAVDATGVGRGVIDLLRRAQLAPVPIQFTGGSAVTKDIASGYTNVPKKDLVSALAIAFETGELRLAAGLEYLDTLKKEMQSFRAKITASANVTFDTWREGLHDDLLFSLAIAVWFARRGGRMDASYHMPLSGRRRDDNDRPKKPEPYGPSGVYRLTKGPL